MSGKGESGEQLALELQRSRTMGPAFDAEIDGPAILDQHGRIRAYMLSVEWRALHEISEALGYPESSVSAQLRHLRKQRFGGYDVEKRRRDSERVWEYRVRKPGGQRDD
jgi:biotin operon repressor